ncbi:MAG: hypothetical protein WKG07_11415 [Hymenobacter sp.]
MAFDNNPISTLRLLSQYARVQYQYGDRYLAQVSLRRDGSSVFGVNNRYGYFPTAALELAPHQRGVHAGPARVFGPQAAGRLRRVGQQPGLRRLLGHPHLRHAAR